MLDDNITSLIKWLIGGGAVAIVTHALGLWRKGSQVQSEVKRDRIVDSGLQFNQDEMRRQLERATLELKVVKDELGKANLRVVEMFEQKSLTSEKIGRLEASQEAYRAQIKQMVDEERRLDRLRKELAKKEKRVDQGVEFLRRNSHGSELVETGWGDLVEDDKDN